MKISHSLLLMLQSFKRKGKNNCKAGSDHYKARLTEDQVIEMRRLAKLPFMDSRVLAELYGVDRSTIRSVLTGKSWRWL